MARAIIFDIDGTLLDSVDLHARAWHDIFRRYGKEVPLKDVRWQIGKGGDELLPVFFSREELKKSGEKMKKERAALFKEQYLQRVKPFPKVRELFQRILQDGTKIGLGSSATKEELEGYKKIANIADLLHAETSSDDADRAKPHPDIFDAALEELGGPDKKEVVVVGDTPYDAQAAGKAGLRTVGVLCGGFPEDELRKAGCFAVYQGPADLLANYEKSPLAP